MLAQPAIPLRPRVTLPHPKPAPIVAGPMVEFLEWIAIRPRTYEQAMEAWRSSCPRFTTWEDALIGGLIKVLPDEAPEVRLTTAGLAQLRKARRIRSQRKETI